MMGALTLRKVTVWRNMVHSGSDDDDLPLVRHDARVDLHTGGARICYTQEPTLLAELPLSSPPPYTVEGRRMKVGHCKVLIPNPNYNGRVTWSQSHPTQHRECCSDVLLRCAILSGRWNFAMMIPRRRRMSPPVS
jgi:hypothetical protein